MLAYVVIVLFATAINAQNDTLDVIHSKMNLDMEEFTLVTTLDLLKNYSGLEQVADALVKAMDSKYGIEWMSLVGDQVSKVKLPGKADPNTILSLKYRDTELVLYQFKIDQPSCNNTTKKSFREIITEASKANPVILNKRNDTANKIIIDTVQELLKREFNQLAICDEFDTHWTGDCYNNLHYRIMVSVLAKFKLGTNYHVSFSTGVYHDYGSGGGNGLGSGQSAYILDEAVVLGDLFVYVWALKMF